MSTDGEQAVRDVVAGASEHARSDESIVAELAALSRIEYDRRREAKADKPRTSSAPKPFAFALELEAELASFSPSLPTDDLAKRLQELAARIPPLSPIDRAMWREGTIKKLAELGFTSPAKIADALLPAPVREETTSRGTDLDFEALEPWAAGTVSPSYSPTEGA